MRALRIVSLLLVAMLAIAGCSASAEPQRPWPTKPIDDFLLGPVQDLPSRLGDGRIVIDAVYQDVQRRVDPESEVLVGDTADWVVVAMCADSLDSGPELTALNAAILPRVLLTDDVRLQAESGWFLGDLYCGRGWSSTPDLDSP